MKRILSILLIILGLNCIIYAALLIIERSNPTRLSFSQTPTISRKSNEKKESYPEAITIKNVKINLPIYPARMKNSEWPTTTQGASYLVSSPIPGEVGNSILYGHNWTSLFGPLQSVRPGDQVIITYADKTQKKFNIIYTSIVNPTQTSILEPSHDKRITLYTCTGFLDMQRFVAVGILTTKIVSSTKN